MSSTWDTVVIGAGVFGLTTALQLSQQGHRNIVVLDRHTPPVPDGSSNDISRVVRFDYADEDYVDIAHEAYLKWSRESRYNRIFYPATYILAMDKNSSGAAWLRDTTDALTRKGLPTEPLENAEVAKRHHPSLSGPLADNFTGYQNRQAGWADAGKAIIQLRDDCIEAGISFISGAAGTVTRFNTDPKKRVRGVQTLANTTVEGDFFILAAGAWTSSLVPMYNSTISTAQVLGYMHLTEAERQRLKALPIYTSFSTGWFNFPPHEESQTLKMAVHGWGYTRKPGPEENKSNHITDSAPLTRPQRSRPNFVPKDGEERLRQGLRELLPEFADRPFQKVAMCWYTDTPTGDFIMDLHPDYTNMFIATGGSGHAFKFLPVLGQYIVRAMKKQLPPRLANKWRFRTEYKNESGFKGDGSRAGPARRELRLDERARL